MKPYDIASFSPMPLGTPPRPLAGVISDARDARSRGYDTDFASINVPFDHASYKQMVDLVGKKRILQPAMMIVIGIGGSNLGTLAIHELLHGRWYNDTNPRPVVYFADTVDTAMLAALIERMQATLQEQEVLLVVISKSGTTTETIVNFYLLLEILKKERPDTYRDYVVAITDQDSALWKVAQQDGYSCLPVPVKVGGRYSVFSAVGIFPLAMIGVDTQRLLEGACSAVDDCTSSDSNDAATIALLLYSYYQHNYTIHDHFIFFPDGESIGRWYRQLIGESIGKEYNIHNKRVRVGITPTVSIGSTDLHSVGQLYLGGPQYTVTSFLTRNYTEQLPIPGQASRFLGVPLTTTDEVMSAIVQGVQQAYRTIQKPFVHINLHTVDEYTIGYLLQMYMLQMIYLGYLLEINPFDQPQVELYKKETKRILNHE